jgi:hypothetical protein
MEMHDGSPPRQKLEEMFELVWAIRDDMLTEAQAVRLNKLISKDAHAREMYFDLIGMLAGLRWNLSASNESSLIVLFPALDPKSNEPAARSSSPLLSSPPHGRYLSARFAIMASSALLVGYFAILFGVAMWNHHNRAGRAQELAVESFVTLTRADDCDWERVPNAATGARANGRRLRVRTGLAELQFANGVKVLVQGPAEFFVRSASSGLLRRGRLIATVPPSAIGFTIDTVTATIVDLGTEFSVAVVESDETVVNVLRGRVSVQPERVIGGARPAPIIVQAGEVRRVLTNGTIQVAHMGSLPGRIKGATASASTVYAGKDHAAVHVVDNSGLMPGSPSGVGHNVLPIVDGAGTMWLSAARKSGKADADPWLIIDLGQVYKISHFHVWNYNEPAGSGHGIKEVEISYSATNPKGTDKLLGGYVFAKAPEVGREYLGEDFSAEFEARYIKLDINSNWDGDDFAYGLAEIQFDGTPIAKKDAPRGSNVN